MNILDYNLFGKVASDYSRNWINLLDIIKDDEGINTILNIGVGEPRQDGSLSCKAWNSLLLNEITTAKQIFNLELDPRLQIIAKNTNDVLLKNTFSGDVRNFNFSSSEIPCADLIFWSHGPEHIHREEWKKTFDRLESMAISGVILQMPGGSHYDYGEDHLSKDIQKGELERFGYTVKYDGVWDSDSCGILAYKIKTNYLEVVI